MPKPWTATVAALDVQAEVRRRFAGDDHHAAAGRLAPPERSAHLDRLAGDDRRRGVADVHAVGVHDPRHDLIVGVHVRRRHVLVGADSVDDLGDVAAGQRFEFAARHPRRIADDAALAAAERHVRHGAFPRHPRRERRDFVERHVRVVADAALGRAQRDVVLDAVAGEDLDFAVVHLHRAGHDDLPLGMGQDFPDARIESEQSGRAVELLEHRVENAAACFHVTPVSRRPDPFRSHGESQTGQATVTECGKSTLAHARRTADCESSGESSASERSERATRAERGERGPASERVRGPGGRSPPVRKARCP